MKTAAGRYAIRASRIGGSVIDSSTSLLQRQHHDIVRLAMGSPAAEAIPAAAFGRISDEVLDATRWDAYDYAATEGDPRLRAALLEFLRSRGRDVEPEQLLITSGGMQGLDLACKLFVDPGDVVVAEAPTYTNGTATIASYQGSIVQVAVDSFGLDVELLEREVARRGVTPKLIYVIPNFQNPSGTTLSLERRLRLLELAGHWHAVVLEDDPYGWLRFEGEPLPSLQELSRDPSRVVVVETFSKIVAPGLRVGWVVADPDVVQRMVAAKQGVDTCTNVPAQRLVAEFIARGELDNHLQRLTEVYRERKRTMLQALERRFGDVEASWTDPEGGFFIWLVLPDGIDTDALFELALAHGVAFIPGSAFSVENRFRNALRMCFASTTPERIDEGIKRMRRAYDESQRDAVEPTEAIP